MLKIFSRSKPAKASVDLGPVHTDMHSHLLPGIDDGSPDMETSLYLVRGMAALGYKKLITTPHVMWDIYQNTTETIRARLEQVRNEIANAGIEIELHAAAEYFLDDHVSDLLRKKEPLLAISGNMVLVEFSLAHPSLSLKEILFEMVMQGYQPVIAHPERYIYLEHNKEFYQELRDIGCLFQLNMLSLAGYYGKSVYELAMYLVRNDFYDMMGSDLHHQRHLEAMGNGLPASTIKKLLDSGKMLNAGL
jgi:tyrosine-protein phosphatase YwqE